MSHIKLIKNSRYANSQIKYSVGHGCNNIE